MLEQQRYHRLARRVVVRCEPQGLEVLVRANQRTGLIGQEIEKVLQIFTGQRVVQVLDDVELDVALAQEFQRAARLASTRVVVDEHFRHRFPRDFSKGFHSIRALRAGHGRQGRS